MVNIQSPTAEIRREKKEERRRRKKKQHENIMVCPITLGDHNNNITLRNITSTHEVSSAPPLVTVMPW